MKFSQLYPILYNFFKSYNLHIFIFLFFTVCTGVNGQNKDIFFNEISGKTLEKGDVFRVVDDRFLDNSWREIDKTNHINNFVALEINDASRAISTTAFVCTVKLQIDQWNAKEDSTAVFKDLVISYDPSGKQAFNARDEFKFIGAHSFKVTVLDVSISAPDAPAEKVIIPPILKLSGYIEAARSLTFDCNAYSSIISEYNASKDRLVLSWLSNSNADEYDVEWTFYDECSDWIQRFSSVNLADYDEIFKNNSTRIVTKNASYELPLVYPNGFLFYRVRGAHFAADGFRQTSPWSQDPGGGSLANYVDRYPITSAHQANLNWQTSTTFAEDGKNAQSVVYADGLPRSRQEMSLSRADSIIIVSEKVYDLHGRPVIQTMPTPAQGYPNTLGFIPNFSRNMAEMPYSASDFDLGSTCNYDIGAMTNKMGASWYYSQVNTKANDPLSVHRFIPDAGGFPFAVTEFTPDPTGRPKRQGGVGAIFQANGLHSTNYYYAAAAQSELNRLFNKGDVGVDDHYQKNMVKDPNGQFSVSYVDANGRTIATALAGDSPTNLQELDSAPNPEPITYDILRNIASETALTSTYTLLVNRSGDHTYQFNYDQQGLTYQEACMSSCFDCLYDLTIKVSDNCGNPIPLFENTQSSIHLDENCGTGPPTLSDYFPLVLQAGEYTVTKTLQISQDAVDKYAALYVAESGCMPKLADITAEFLTRVDTNCNIGCQECLGLIRPYFGTPEYPELLASCNEYCNGQYATDHCEIYKQTLLADVSPGGQYMTLQLPTIPATPESCELLVTDPASLLYADSQNPTTTPAYKFPSMPYKDEEGNDDFVIIDGVSFKPQDLNVCDFLKYWQPSWANALLNKHPENCLLTECIAQNLNVVDLNKTYAQAQAMMYFDDGGQEIVNKDSYFQATGGGFSHAAAMEAFLSNFAYVNGQPYNINEVLVSFISRCTLGTCTLTYTNLCPSDREHFWSMFRSIYMGKRFGYFSTDVANTNCGLTQCIGLGLQTPPQTNCSQPGGSIYLNKTKRWVVKNVVPDGANYTNILEQNEIEVNNGITSSCTSNCQYMADTWIAKLKESACVSITPAQIINLRPLLVGLCMGTCDIDHPYGAINDPQPAPGQPADIRAAMISVGINVTNCSETCNDLFIGFPGSFDHPQWVGGAQTAFWKQTENTCICDRLLGFQDCYGQDTQGFATFLDYINSLSDVTITQEQLDLFAPCDENSTCFTFPENTVVPPQFNCTTCKNIDEVQKPLSNIENECNGSSDELKAAYLNRALALNLDWEDYQAFLDYHAGSNNSACERVKTLCPRSEFPPVEIPDCIQEQIDNLTEQAIDAYNAEVAARVAEFKRNYLAHCINALQETFTTTTDIKEYHYTLYYYDRAGHLIQTVPPDGVKVGNPSDHTLKTTYRYDCFGNAVERNTPDGGTTQSWFDYLGRAVVSQDARQAEQLLYSYTIYDALGRPIETGEKTQTGLGPMTNTIARDPVLLTAWLNQKLNARNDITRTYYDYSPMDWSIVSSQALASFAPENLRKRVSAVVFFKNYPTTFLFGGFIDPSTYEYATHYSYDITGNVKTLIQDIRELEGSGNNRYKRIDYEYDLISGKVNQVVYQANRIDQFIHRYHYDLNNRLIKTETGTLNDEIPAHWETDAEYQYYLHGPLARTITGQRKVQGTDYAYTLQGWTKGVNASAMNAFGDDSQIPEYLYIHDNPIPDGVYRARTAIISHGRVPAGGHVTFKAGKFIHLEEPNFKVELGGYFKALIDPALVTPNAGDIVDMGRDGTPENDDIARDALSYTLGFFNGDYQKISDLSTPDFEISKQYGNFTNAAPELFNGNIRHIAQQVKTLSASGFLYNYDQLNRLKTMDYWNRPNGGSWGGSTAYHEAVSYDGNGNILHYLRHAADPDGNMQPMDDLTYHYDPGHPNNRLNRVTDAVPTTPFADDVETQADAQNYVYDGSGNLIQDKSRGPAGTSFTWSMYGKLQSVSGLPNSGTLTYGYDAMQKRVIKSYTGLVTAGGVGAIVTTKTYYIRDAQGNTMATYERTQNNTLTLKELDLYGSARLGLFKPNKVMYVSSTGDVATPIGTAYLGKKEYELSNHLGNVLATVGDQRDPVDLNNDNFADYFEPRVASAREYYPFGMLMPNRKAPANGNTAYRYGFNGKESDDEAYGDDGFQDYGMRVYTPGLGRFLSVDPIAGEYPWYTPYQFAGNMPIWAVDLDGLEESIATDESYKQSLPRIKIRTDDFLNTLGESDYKEKLKKYLERGLGLAQGWESDGLTIGARNMRRYLEGKGGYDILSASFLSKHSDFNDGVEEINSYVERLILKSVENTTSVGESKFKFTYELEVPQKFSSYSENFWFGFGGFGLIAEAEGTININSAGADPVVTGNIYYIFRDNYVWRNDRDGLSLDNAIKYFQDIPTHKEFSYLQSIGANFFSTRAYFKSSISSENNNSFQKKFQNLGPIHLKFGNVADSKIMFSENQYSRARAFINNFGLIHNDNKLINSSGQNCPDPDRP